MAIRFTSCFLSCSLVCAAAPQLHRLVPFGGMRGTEAAVEMIGEQLSNTTGVWFDSPDLAWVKTVESSSGRVRGTVRIASTAALGPHLVNVRTLDGRTNSRLFNVTQFPSVHESGEDPQRIELKQQVVHGYMSSLADIDSYQFEARAGERWTFDLRALEHGSHLECEMALLDERGKRVAFNDDRDDYLETPFIEHTFARAGVYRVKLDQYRGPQGVGCSTNCGYMLQISQLPVVQAAAPLGAAPGAKARLRVFGRALQSVREAYLTRVRAGEYYRLTFPNSIPIAARPDVAERIDGRVVKASAEELEAEFAIPANAGQGLWRVWLRDQHGIADGISIEISSEPTIDGWLQRAGQEDSHEIQAKAGQPIHAYTLAAQLGLPTLDTVLELFDRNGKVVAEHDDLMTGQGTVIGNPDSSLYHVPTMDQKMRLVVRDRIGRGGPEYAYRLRIRSERPSFQLQSDPEEFVVTRGGEAELSALLIREPGFQEGVEVWVEGLPEGVTATRGQFRADQYFGPSDDGDNVIIPAAHLKIRAPASLAVGEYPLRMYGRASGGGKVVEAFTTLWIGPRGKRNDNRRPMPAVTMNVVEPESGELSMEQRNFRLGPKPTMLTATARDVPADAELRVTGLPPGATSSLTRDGDRITAEVTSPTGAGDAGLGIAIEAKVAGRWVATRPVGANARAE